MTWYAVEIRNFTVHTARRCLLDVGRLQVSAREIAAIMGPNGAGKTTLLRACLGLAAPSQGEVRVLDCDVTRLSARALAQFRCRVGYVPQILPTRSELPLTVREVVAIGRTGRAGTVPLLSAKPTGDVWMSGLTGLALPRCPIAPSAKSPVANSGKPSSPARWRNSPNFVARRTDGQSGPRLAGTHRGNHSDTSQGNRHIRCFGLPRIGSHSTRVPARDAAGPWTRACVRFTGKCVHDRAGCGSLRHGFAGDARGGTPCRFAERRRPCLISFSGCR